MSEMSDTDRLFVTALARGLDVLAAFKAGDRTLGNTELAQRCHLPKSTVSRLTYTLCQLGYLSQDEAGKYHPAPAVLTLGFAALAGLDLRERAREPMRRLSQETGLSVTLGVRQGTRVVYVETCRAPTRVGIRLEVGSSVPLATTAIGRALYSVLPVSEQSGLESPLAEEYGPRWPILAARLYAERAAFQAKGFCASYGEFEPDIHAVAVPIMGSSPLMAINCSGPAYRLTPIRWAEEIAPKVVALAAHLSVE
ncbi:IclR family transcriptional regulator [Chitinimonas sp. BJB300]|uniref:IclR family transcriptional regulator n=1 Tax=Chitinimonas sp. BJB300 TaxID=1559339 RepID=UPI000C0F344C|nr:IclR family transcriptional regulator [Chitinimonas sp. BJB300]PHV12286.1 AsnC family transcriptional regulator [Chitinimonas sp. BJB300]TSJ88147.1 IclR family transcriptional regulator [Chitinimonas sp. BJB300]